MKNLIVCGLLIAVMAVAVTEAIECNCNLTKCTSPPPSSCNPNQFYNPRGGFCGCCGACINAIDEGQQCPIPRFRGGLPPTSACRPGLVCTPQGDGTGICLPECSSPPYNPVATAESSSQAEAMANAMSGNYDPPFEPLSVSY